MRVTIDIAVLVAFAIAGFSAYEIWTRHLLADGTFWQRLWVGCRQSAVTALTHVFAWVSTIGLCVMQDANDLATEAANALGDPDLKTRLLGMVPPTWTAWAGLGVAVVFYVARRRTQGSTPST